MWRSSTTFGLSVEDLDRGISKLRSRVSGHVFHTLGLIEQWRRGVRRMTAARRRGTPSAGLRGGRPTFRVTVSTQRIGRPTFDEIDQAILDALVGGAGRLTSAIAQAIHLTNPARHPPRLARLVQRGLVSEIGTGPQNPKRRYFRAE